MDLTDGRKQELKENYLRVCERVEEAKIRRGGSAPVTLLAASKTRPAEEIVYLAKECGLTLCGENHAQEFRDKFDAVTLVGAQMDFIGHLQSNKIKYVAGKAGLIHSIDSVKIAADLDTAMKKLGKTQDILVELNVGGEATKTGASRSEIREILDEIGSFSSLSVRGMMAMVPKCENNTEKRKYFEESYRIFLDFFAKMRHNDKDPVLSMGMSDSFEAAIEAGATVVRVGSLIFGERDYGKH